MTDVMSDDVAGSVYVTETRKLASQFISLDAAQLLVIEFCRAIVESFIGKVRDDLTEGFIYYEQALKEYTCNSQNSCERPRVAKEIIHNGYTATLFFSPHNVENGIVNIHLLMTACSDDSDPRCCRVFCQFDDSKTPSEVFNLTLGFEECAEEAGDKLLKDYAATVYEGMNSRLGWVEGKPRLGSVGIVIRD